MPPACPLSPGLSSEREFRRWGWVGQWGALRRSQTGQRVGTTSSQGAYSHGRFSSQALVGTYLRKHLVCKKGPRSAWQLQRICLWAWDTFATLSFHKLTSLLQEPGRKWNWRPKGLVWGICDIMPLFFFGWVSERFRKSQILTATWESSDQLKNKIGDRLLSTL